MVRPSSLQRLQSKARAKQDVKNEKFIEAKNKKNTLG